MRSDRIAVVLGASSGIGSAVVDILAEKRYGLLLTCRDKKRIAQRRGVHCERVSADLTRMDDLNRLKNAIEMFVIEYGYGHVAALFNLALPWHDEEKLYVDSELAV